MKWLSNNSYWRLFKTTWLYAQKKKRFIITYYFLLIIGQLIVLLNPYLLGKMVDTVVQGQERMFEHLLMWLGLYLLTSLGFWIFHAPGRLIERHVALYVSHQMIDQLYAYIKDLPLKWHRDHHSGNTINRINKATSSLYLFAQSQFMFIGNFIRLFAPIVFLFYIDLKLGSVMVAVAVLIFWINIKFDQVIVSIYRKINELGHKFSATLFDYVSNIATVITLRLGDQTRDELRDQLKEVAKNYRREARWSEVKWFSVDFLLTCLVTGILATYVWLQTKSTASIQAGTFVMVFQYLYRACDTFYVFASEYSELVQRDTDVQAVQSIIEDTKSLVIEPTFDSYLSLSWRKIKIQNLNFSYYDKEKHEHQLKNISLSLSRGQRIALVGASGSGKSTLLALLRGLYVPHSAEMWIDEAHYNGLYPLATQTTLVPQEPEIFENTILYNITFGISHTEEEVAQALRIACFDTVIQQLPKGLQTDIREKGVNLSGGQKQRLALTRAIFAAQKSSLLLLDEPTSSVDTTNERLIYENIFKAFSQTTIISSIHRLHLLDQFDWIYVLQEGKILEEGGFHSLLNRKGYLYYEWDRYLQKKNED